MMELGHGDEGYYSRRMGEYAELGVGSGVDVSKGIFG